MSKRSHKILIFIGILAVSIISACFGGVWAAKCYKAAQFELLENISQGLIHNQSQAFEIVLEILKEYSVLLWLQTFRFCKTRQTRKRNFGYWSTLELFFGFSWILVSAKDLSFAYKEINILFGKG